MSDDAARDDIDWNFWCPFPDPENRGMLIAPFGAGVYQLRHGQTINNKNRPFRSYRFSHVEPVTRTNGVWDSF